MRINSVLFPHRVEYKIYETLNKGKPFLSLNPTQKAEILSFLCNELLCNQAITKQVEENIENVATLRRDKWVIDCDLRKYRAIKAKREAQAEREAQEKEEKEAQEAQELERAKENGETEDHDEKGSGDEESAVTRSKAKAKLDNEGDAGLDDDSGDSGAENEETTVAGMLLANEQDEEPGMTNEEVDKKIDRLQRQCTMATNKLNKAVHSLRVTSLGQDRYRRRYWVLPSAGGVFVEGLASAEPEELPNNVMGPDDFAAEEREKQETESKAENDETKDDAKADSAECDSKKAVENGVADEPEAVSDSIKEESKPLQDDKEADEQTEADQSAKTNGKVDNEESEKLDKKTVKDGDEKSPWLSPIVASVLAGSMMFGNQNGKANTNSNASTPSLQNEKSAPAESQKPWFTILPRVPCCETLTDVVKEEEADAAESEKQTEDAKGNEDSARTNGQNFFQTFLYPHVLNTLIGKNGANRDSVDSQANSVDAGGVKSEKVNESNEKANASLSIPNGILAFEDIADICPSLQKKLQQQREQQHAEPKKIPAEFQYGWWRISDPFQLRTLIDQLHERGVRERALQKHLQKYLSYISSKCKCYAAEFDITELDRRISQECPYGAPLDDVEDVYHAAVACKLDVAVLEQIENLEEKIANSSMQVRNWKPKPRVTQDPNVRFAHKLCEDVAHDEASECDDESDPDEASVNDEKDDEPTPPKTRKQAKQAKEAEPPPPPPPRPETVKAERADDGTLNPVIVGRELLLSTEAVIERRYLKPPLGYKSNVIFSSGGDEYAENAADENAPSGLVRWRDAVRECRTGSELALLLHFLESCIAWDKSIMRAVGLRLLHCRVEWINWWFVCLELPVLFQWRERRSAFALRRLRSRISHVLLQAENGDSRRRLVLLRVPE